MLRKDYFKLLFALKDVSASCRELSTKLSPVEWTNEAVPSGDSRYVISDGRRYGLGRDGFSTIEA